MVLDPAATPVTTPELFTVALTREEEIQGEVAEAVFVPVKVMVEPVQTLFPEEEVMVGKALTVIVFVAWQSLLLV